MSQAGKVLHLYVEVRSVAEEEGRGDGTPQMLQCPDVLPHCQRSASPNHTHALPPVSQHQTGFSSHSLPASKSPPRQSVSFQLQNPDATGSPTRFHRQDVLHDSLNQLLQVLAPGTPGPCQHGPLGHSQSAHMDPYPLGRMLISPSSTSSGTITGPNTPTSTRKSYEAPGMGVEEGKTSVVTFGFVEKANVHGHHTCRSESGNPPNRTEGQLQERLSDRLRYNGQPEQGDPYPNHLHPFRSPQGSPYLQRTTPDPVARDATYRALEEFGSPELRRRFAGHIPEHCSPTLPRHFQSSRCRSWGGSPVLPRSAHSLPSKAELLDRGVSRSLVNALPRSPAHEHLSTQSGYHSVGPTSTPRSHGPPQSQHRQWAGDESPRLSSKFHPPLPAGRPTDIQHEIPMSMFPSRTGYQAMNPHQSVKSSYSNISDTSHNATDGSLYSYSDNSSHCRASRCCSRAGGAVSPTYGRRNLSKCLNANVASKLAVEATKRSTLLAERRPPSPTSSQTEAQMLESPKMRGSFLRESHPFIAHHGQGSLESLQSDNQNYRWKTEHATPHTRPGRVSPLLSQKSSSSPASPASSARLNCAAASQSQVLDRQHHRRSSPTKDGSALHHYQPPLHPGDHKPMTALYDDRFAGSLMDSPELSRRFPCSPVSCPPPRNLNSSELCDFRTTSAQVYSPSKEVNYRKPVGIKTSSQDYHTPVRSVTNSEREEGQDHSGAAGTSSQSSSGVTGSMGDSQLEGNDSTSPETSSQCSHDTADTGSGIQSDGSTATPSSRSQKIAQAKWDFLFGGPTEESRCRKEAATPPPSVAPSPAPRSSLRVKTTNQRRGRDIEAPKVTHHKVRQIEVELVTSDTRGSAPKTGIIRQTIKYSETDLDAVPLRCYRETDLDEVMRAEAEAEAAEEADSDFGSNRSFLGNSFSPPSPKPRTDGRTKVEEEEEEEYEQEEEGVVSWASVRMLGDRQKQRATREEDEVFSLLLKGALSASDSHGGLKSPISLGSPHRPSESNLDSFSRHFESIMESHRAKGTSYSSLDSVDLLTSGSTSVFTFDLPTLTPEIQSQICDSAKQIMELSFAPLAHPEPPSSRSDTALSGGAGLLRDGPAPPLRTGSERETGRRSGPKDGFRKTNSAPSLHGSPR
ncbi:hypothetical protein PBY51_015495 [Eleginops maclovinus]|uniref:Uncharacterized protein n=2 Tax=Eleginops maclovinus TaxID=56733 RepID=A0AAN7X7K2_ELEMC|nr:hypothetical protein PBY51_015495 [Eleginops maclovinus]